MTFGIDISKWKNGIITRRLALVWKGRPSPETIFNAKRELDHLWNSVSPRTRKKFGDPVIHPGPAGQTCSWITQAFCVNCKIVHSNKPKKERGK